MEKNVLGIDLGTGSVKVTAVNKLGDIVGQESTSYPNPQPQPGWSEQNPNDWVNGTIAAIRKLVNDDNVDPVSISGASFSGQMHGLVLLDKNNHVIRPAILWNDTRTTKQRKEIEDKLGKRFVEITGNQPLEGFTITKLLWVKENEPENWAKVKTFLLPKDYLRFKMTGNIAVDFSDATGTTLLDIHDNKWSLEICQVLGIPEKILPPLIQSIDYAGNVIPDFADEADMSTITKVYGGAADNSAGAVGAGIMSPNNALVSVGTSGVVLHHEVDLSTDYGGRLQMEDHSIPNTYYSMGVTLAAGDSLTWYKNTFVPDEDFTEMTDEAGNSPIGANGLLFTPYIAGERMPHADSQIRGSFVGIDRTQVRRDFTRAVMEGITFSLKDILTIYDEIGATIDHVTSIGGGAKSAVWTQIQADIFDKPVTTLKNEQGPGIGAAMIAAVGLGWFTGFPACADQFIKFGKTYEPIQANADKYAKLFKIYQQIYPQTKKISHELRNFR
ncbi:xylulokinase [Fructilactobacillus fructivorans]|uniref:Xylulose kinase n=1 Tax=Fructilactobacillus fructivorans TaxID=1614 RepID=A0A0C1PNL5_9LACO|nr:xylulokinase [Fructilactobacillus fructivorans]KID42332.1 Xylulose kinase [Fructilactobacillus fructivorans]MCT0151049.1 xylulokinase [Fructilactobacillus fructivorans]MCT2867393.1 xylulokinase [Fructilactobacillus fructivorans]MCT2869088.1 xylulokinase [Fructilactobacillus fructivorans]MCT2873192.1 xylulokinase [Fructilactobacillus fructivorans]